MRLAPRRLVVLLSLALTLPVAARAADGGHARGSFSSHGATLGVVDAYAFHGTGTLSGAPVLVVAVSNRGFVASAIDEYWDRRHALDALFRDDETGLVFFEFAPDGGYRGYSFYFGSGNGCGYCGGGEVASTVRLAGDRLSGRLTQTGNDEQPGIDLELDVPVSSDDHGAAQGAGGGAPGAAYLAYHAALTGGDRVALRARLSEERRETWDGAAAAGDSDGFVAYLERGHPARLTVVEAYVRGETALVRLTGDGELGKVVGEALLTREAGAWRFEEELFRTLAD